MAAQRKPDDPQHPSWLGRLLGRVHPNVAAVALVNKNARVALAALEPEPHFAKSLCLAAGLPWTTPAMMMEASTHQAIAGFVARLSCQALEDLARQHDIPLQTLPD